MNPRRASWPLACGDSIEPEMLRDDTGLWGNHGTLEERLGTKSVEVNFGATSCEPHLSVGKSVGQSVSQCAARSRSDACCAAEPEKTHGKGKALAILAHKIGRAVFYILTRKTVYSLFAGAVYGRVAGPRVDQPRLSRAARTELAALAM